MHDFPVDTPRRFNVYKTSIGRRQRRIDVLYTLKRCRVSTGLVWVITKCLQVSMILIFLIHKNKSLQKI